jgi:plasmid stabilization system protein ParE
MRYTVTWREDAQDELARIWMGATDREAVRQAADEIDRQLLTSRRARGNDQQGVYELTIPPLHVVCEVSPDDRKVTVLRVLYLGQ